MSKKVKRLESKAQKVKAFLEVVQRNDQHKKELQERLEVEMQDSSDSGDEPPSKKVKTIVRQTLETVKTTEGLTNSGMTSQGGDESPEIRSRIELAKAELERLRAEKKARQKASMERPKVFLVLEDLIAQSSSSEGLDDQECLLYLLDLQHLLLYAIQGNIASYKPRWCKLLRQPRLTHIVLIVLSEVSATEYQTLPECFPFMKESFNMTVNMTSPCEYGSSWAEELFQVPLSNKRRKRLTEKNKKVASTEPGAGGSTEDNKDVPVDAFSRLELLLNPQQLILERYPVPVREENCKDYVYTKEQYEKVTSTSPMFAIDCEMCLTSIGKNELARVSVVNEKLEVIYDKLVKPPNKILNYLTKYSGITAKMLKGVTTTLQDVQRDLQHLLPPDAILCGHSLNFDLNALKMFHPYIIDTSVMYNLAGMRHIKPSLKRLTAIFLGKDIQVGNEGHNPCEDSLSTMELVQHKLAHCPDYGDSIYEWLRATGSEHGLDCSSLVEDDAVESNDSKDTKMNPTQSHILERKQVFFQRPGLPFCSLFDITGREGKTALLIDSMDALGEHQGKAEYCKTESDKKTVKRAKKAVTDKFLTVIQLNEFVQCKDSQTQSQTQEILRTLDKQVKKIMTHVEAKSLVAVVLPGRRGKTDIYKASCSVKIT